MREFYLKIQANLIKKWEKITRLSWGENEENIFFTTNGYVGYIIPQNLKLLDTSKFQNISLPLDDYTKLIPDDTGYEEANISGSEINGKRILIIMKSKNSITYVDEKYFKEFLKRNFKFKIGNPFQPIKVYIENKMCAIVMPVKHEKED